MSLTLRNPHSVLAALAARPLDVLEVQLAPGKPSEAWGEVAEAARQHQIPVRTAMSSGPAPRGEKSQRQSQAIAFVRERPSVAAEELWTEPAAGQLWLALDCLQDPHNVGAIVRTAAFFGVRGLLLTRDRSAPLSGTVYDVASGGMEAIPVCVVSNLASTLKQAKEAGLWILGSSEHASRGYTEIPRDRPWLLVIGNEEQGLRRLTLDLCDDLCGIPAQGAVTSLNASVAAGILIASLGRAP